MKEDLEKLREDYKGFKKGNKSVLSVRVSALKLLHLAKNEGDVRVVEEIKDMLVDLELSIEENKCNCNRGNCHKGHSCC